MKNKIKIMEMLERPDFDHLMVETENTVTHIRKMADNSSHGSYWMDIGGQKTPRIFYGLESLINELYSFMDNRGERIRKISTLLIIDRK